MDYLGGSNQITGTLKSEAASLWSEEGMTVKGVKNRDATELTLNMKRRGPQTKECR